MERVQSEEYELYVCGRNLLQPTAPRSLVRGRAVRIGMTASTFFGLKKVEPVIPNLSLYRIRPLTLRGTKEHGAAGLRRLRHQT